MQGETGESVDMWMLVSCIMPKQWLRRVNAAQAKAELEAIRKSIKHGRPFGGGCDAASANIADTILIIWCRIDAPSVAMKLLTVRNNQPQAAEFEVRPNGGGLDSRRVVVCIRDSVYRRYRVAGAGCE